MVRSVYNYILITLCKDEEIYLPHLIESVMKLTFKPKLWLIVDDNSADKTHEIISGCKSLNTWIRSIHLRRGERDLGIHFAKIMKLGIETAMDICEKEEINFEYIGMADADVLFDSTYFEDIINEFRKNLNLGIAGGGLRINTNGKIEHIQGVEDEPSGGNMVIRKECYYECGGIPVSYSCDSVLKVNARLKGWKTKRFEQYLVTLARETSTSEGYWQGYVQRGRSAYYRNLNVFHVLYIGFTYLFHSPHYIAIAYLYGYFRDLFKNGPQIENEEIKRYYWNKWKKCIR